jgi:hypothetical protein
LTQGGFGRFDAGFRLGHGAGIEQLGVAGLDHRQQSFAGDDLVAGVHADPEDSAVERGGDDVLLANPRLAVFVDRHAQHAPPDRDQIDFDRLGQEGVAQAGDDQRDDQ